MIRQIQDKDWETVMKWVFEIAKESFDTVVPGILERKIKEDYERFPEGFIVSEEENLNGLLWFETIPEKKTAFIHAIYVDSNYRGKGVSDKLIDYLEDYCAKREIKTIDLNVTLGMTDAINFYKRRGFKVKRYNMSKKL